jgi:hypothetical protein
MIGQVAGLIVAKKVQPRLRARCAISDKRFMTLDFMRYGDLSGRVIKDCCGMGGLYQQT